jgi:hypothetical protein
VSAPIPWWLDAPAGFALELIEWQIEAEGRAEALGIAPDSGGQWMAILYPASGRRRWWHEITPADAQWLLESAPASHELPPHPPLPIAKWRLW